MSTGESDSTFPVAVPLWQLILVLLGLPALYIVNSLLPWSTGLFRRHDHAFFVQFWGSIAVLHWGSLALVFVLLKRTGGRLADIGLDLSPLKVAAMVGIPLVVGLTLTVLRAQSDINHASSLQSSAVLPTSTGERLFWIFISLTAGFCEELIYRGFSIRMLQARNMPAGWRSILLPWHSSLSMAFGRSLCPHFLLFRSRACFLVRCSVAPQFGAGSLLTWVD